MNTKVSLGYLLNEAMTVMNRTILRNYRDSKLYYIIADTQDVVSRNVRVVVEYHDGDFIVGDAVYMRGESMESYVFYTAPVAKEEVHNIDFYKHVPTKIGSEEQVELIWTAICNI